MPDPTRTRTCLLYTSDAADEMQCVDLGGRRIIKKIFFKQKTAYEISLGLVGSEMCIRDRSYTQYSCSLTAVLDGVPCGIATLFLMPYKKVAHHSLFKIVVDPLLHRKGIGTSLVRNIKHLAKNYFHLEFLHVEVFEGNPLIALLQQQGFYEFARQDLYVKNEGKYLARILLETAL